MGAWLLIIAPFIMFIPQLISEVAWNQPRYNPIFNWVSDNGVPVVTKFGTHVINSPLHALMNIGFVGNGILVLAAFILLRDKWLQGISNSILPILYSVGVVLVGTFPGYEWRLSFLHSIGATLFLIAGELLSINFGRYYLNKNNRGLGWALITLGIFSFMAFLVMFGFSSSGFEGLIERLSIYPVLITTLIEGIAFLDRK